MAGLKNCQGNIPYLNSNKTQIISTDSVNDSPRIAPGPFLYIIRNIIGKKRESIPLG
jgi:hypothetical protein